MEKLNPLTELFLVIYIVIISSCQHIFEDWPFWGVLLLSTVLAIFPAIIFRKFTGFGKQTREFVMILIFSCGLVLFILHRLSKVKLF